METSFPQLSTYHSLGGSQRAPSLLHLHVRNLARGPTASILMRISAPARKHPTRRSLVPHLLHARLASNASRQRAVRIQYASKRLRSPLRRQSRCWIRWVARGLEELGVATPHSRRESLHRQSLQACVRRRHSLEPKRAGYTPRFPDSGSHCNKARTFFVH